MSRKWWLSFYEWKRAKKTYWQIDDEERRYNKYKRFRQVNVFSRYVTRSTWRRHLIVKTVVCIILSLRSSSSIGEYFFCSCFQSWDNRYGLLDLKQSINQNCSFFHFWLSSVVTRLFKKNISKANIRFLRLHTSIVSFDINEIIHEMAIYLQPKPTLSVTRPWRHSSVRMMTFFSAWSPGLGCTTTSHTDPPSAKVAPVGCQLATMTLKIKTVTVPKRWVAQQKLSPKLGRQCIWAELRETGGLSAALSVNRRGRRHSARPRSP